MIRVPVPVPVILFLVLLLVCPVFSGESSTRSEDILLILPDDCLAAAVVPSLDRLSGSIDILARRLGPSHPIAGLPSRWDSLPGLDLARPAAVLLFSPPDSPAPSFVFIVPVVDYDAFLRADPAARVDRLPSGVDRITQPSTGNALHAGLLPDSRVVIARQEDSCLRIRDAKYSLAGVLSPDVKTSLETADLAVLLFPQRALPTLAPVLDSLPPPSTPGGRLLLDSAFACADMTQLIALSFSLSEKQKPVPTASLSLQFTVLPAPDTPFAHFLQTPETAPASPLQPAWRPDTLALATWNVPLHPDRREALQSLLAVLRDLVFPPAAPASKPAAPAPAGTSSPELDPFVRGSLAFLDSCTGVGAACILPADTPGRIGAFLSNRFENPSLEDADRFIQLWLPLLRRLLTGLSPGASLTFQPRSGELLGRVDSTLRIDTPHPPEPSPRSSLLHFFVADPRLCLSWNLSPDSLDAVLDQLDLAAPSSAEPYPRACLRFAASLYALVVARHPDQAPRILPLARSLNLIGPPGLVGAMQCAPGEVSLFVSLDFNDLALALTALAPPESPPSP